MDRHLIVCDNFSPLAPSSASIQFATEVANNGSDVSFVYVKRNYEIQNESESEVPGSVDSSIHALTLEARWNLDGIKKFRRLVGESQSEHIHLFCEDPFPILKRLVGVRVRNITVNLASRQARILTRDRLLCRLAFGNRLNWSVSALDIANDLIRCGVPAGCVQVRVNKLPSHLAEQHSRDRIIPSSSNRLGVPEDHFLVTSCAPLDRRAAFMDLIWAAELIKAVRDDVHVAIIGDFDKGRFGPEVENPLQQLQRFIGFTKLEGHVHFVGWSNNACEIIACSDMYCEPSGWIPNSLPLQFAMQNSVPAILPNSRYNLDSFRDGDDCLIFPKGAKNEIGRKIMRLVKDGELAQTLAANAQDEMKKVCSSQAA